MNFGRTRAPLKSFRFANFESACMYSNSSVLRLVYRLVYVEFRRSLFDAKAYLYEEPI